MLHGISLYTHVVTSSVNEKRDQVWDKVDSVSIRLV